MSRELMTYLATNPEQLTEAQLNALLNEMGA
jgi:hypothetical protein